MLENKNTRRDGHLGGGHHDGNDKEHQEPLFDPTPFTDDSTTVDDYTAVQVETGKQRIREFWEWVNDNTQAWGDGIAHLLDLAAHGQYVSASVMFSFIRSHDYVDAHGLPVSCDNNFGGIVNRVLIREYPPLSGKVKPRKSVYDVLDVMRGEQP